MVFVNVVIRMTLMLLLIGATASGGGWLFAALAFVNGVLFIFWAIRAIEEADSETEKH